MTYRVILIILAICLIVPTSGYNTYGLPTNGHGHPQKPVARRSYSVEISWNPSPDTSVAGYTMFVGYAPHEWVTSFELRGRENVSFTITNCQRRIWYYVAVTCWDANGHQSKYSKQLRVLIP